MWTHPVNTCPGRWGQALSNELFGGWTPRPSKLSVWMMCRFSGSLELPEHLSISCCPISVSLAAKTGGSSQAREKCWTGSSLSNSSRAIRCALRVRLKNHLSYWLVLVLPQVLQAHRDTAGRRLPTRVGTQAAALCRGTQLLIAAQGTVGTLGRWGLPLLKWGPKQGPSLAGRCPHYSGFGCLCDKQSGLSSRVKVASQNMPRAIMVPWPFLWLSQVKTFILPTP